MNRLIKPIRTHLINPVKSLASEGKLSGMLLLGATMISIFVSNLPVGNNYLAFWKINAGFPFLNMSLAAWITDGLLPVFFLMVGLEIKRELLKGELSRLNQAILPVVAAAGGMIVPAIFFFLFNLNNPETIHGWAIPTATDIAFSLGALSLLGKRIPFSMVVFLMALAIIDDLGAILIIVVFYSGELHAVMLLSALGVIALLFILNRLKVKYLAAYLLPGIFLWFFILRSGIHPTIAGVVLAFTIPMSLGEFLEHKLTRTVSYFILPLFALANTAIPVSFGLVGNLFSGLSIGIVLGLFLGKPIGIVLSTYILVKGSLSPMLTGVNWKMMIGLGLVAGIGFTMSIFIATLSFSHEILVSTAKLAVISGSVISALTGMLLLYFFSIKKKRLSLQGSNLPSGTASSIQDS
jgi:NhaA family Na+:H+ antiporter